MAPEEPQASHDVAREAWSGVFNLTMSEASRRRVAGICEDFGVTKGQMRALVTMGPGPARPMKELAGTWNCDASYVTVLVDDLEERGWVERQAHPDDRRSRVVVLTPAGELVRHDLLERLGEPPEFFAAITEAEQRTMCDILRKLLVAAGGPPSGSGPFADREGTG